MKILLDKEGAAFELIPKGEGKAELRCQHFPELTHTYKIDFIESAIKAGLLIELPEKFVPQKLRMMGV